MAWLKQPANLTDLSMDSIMLKRVMSAPVFALLAGLFLSVSAQANLIVNGSFEDNAVNAGSWKAFNASAVNGWEGSRIEIWNGMSGVKAPDGNNHIELNADPYNGAIFSIFQNLATSVGQTYDVSFFYRARQNDTEAFSFSVANLALVLDNHTTSAWSKFEGSFVAGAATSVLTFSTLTNGTYGNFIDNVVVTARASVNEASSLVMLTIGILGLMLVRRKNRA
jgi:hypothetical protein